MLKYRVANITVKWKTAMSIGLGSLSNDPSLPSPSPTENNSLPPYNIQDVHLVSRSLPDNVPSCRSLPESSNLAVDWLGHFSVVLTRRTAPAFTIDASEPGSVRCRSKAMSFEGTTPIFKLWTVYQLVDLGQHTHEKWQRFVFLWAPLTVKNLHRPI